MIITGQRPKTKNKLCLLKFLSTNAGNDSELLSLSKSLTRQTHLN